LTGKAVFISDQRVFALKRKASLRIEMLKQVQTWSAGYQLKGMGSREHNRLNNSGFLCTYEVIRAARLGSPLLCHPELVSGSSVFEKRGYG